MSISSDHNDHVGATANRAQPASVGIPLVRTPLVISGGRAGAAGASVVSIVPQATISSAHAVVEPYFSGRQVLGVTYTFVCELMMEVH